MPGPAQTHLGKCLRSYRCLSCAQACIARLYGCQEPYDCQPFTPRSVASLRSTARPWRSAWLAVLQPDGPPVTQNLLSYQAAEWHLWKLKEERFTARRIDRSSTAALLHAASFLPVTACSSLLQAIKGLLCTFAHRSLSCWLSLKRSRAVSKALDRQAGNHNGCTPQLCGNG